MGSGQALLVALGFSIAACAQPRPAPQYSAQIADVITPRSQAQLPASLDTAARPWAVGQWAIYKTVVGGDIGYIRLDVIAIDGCGTWVRFVMQNVDSRWSSSFCVRDEPGGRKTVAYVVERIGDNLRTLDSRGDPYVSRVMGLFQPPSGTASSTNESLDILYGHIDGASRIETPKQTTWSHPAVPFAGMVRQVLANGTSRELVAFGDHSEESLVPDIALVAMKPARLASRLWAAGGGGVGIARGYRREDSDGSSTFRLRAGGLVTPAVDVMTELVRVSSESADQLSKQDSTAVMAGTRWRPFLRSRSRFLNDLHLRGGLGVSFLDRTMAGSTSAEASLAGSLGVVLTAQMTNSLAIAMDFGDEMQVSGAGTRHNLLATGMLEVRWDRN